MSLLISKNCTNKKRLNYDLFHEIMNLSEEEKQSSIFMVNEQYNDRLNLTLDFYEPEKRQNNLLGSRLSSNPNTQ